MCKSKLCVLFISVWKIGATAQKKGNICQKMQMERYKYSCKSQFYVNTIKLWFLKFVSDSAVPFINKKINSF